MRFNWQGLSEKDFLKYMFVHLLSGGLDMIDKLSGPTKQFTDVELTIQVNGVEVDAKAFIDTIERGLTHHAEEAANEMLTGTAKLHEFNTLVETLNRELASKMRTLAKETLGIDLDEDIY